MLKTGIVFIGALVILLAPLSVSAQKTNSIAVSPPSFELNAKPGDKVTNVIKIENITKQSMTLKVDSQNFTAYGDGGQVVLTDEDSSFSLKSWIDYEKDTIKIAPQQTAQFEFTITIPENAEPGSHYGAVVFTTDTTEGTGGSGAVVTQQIGTLILIRIPGKVYEDAKLKSFTTKEKVYTKPVVSFQALVENTGNVHVKPYGFITIKNILGWKEKTYELQGRNVLPGSKRVYNDDIPFESVGYYTAEITLLYAGGGKVLTKDVTFFALNTPQTLKIGIGILVFIVIYLLLRKRINKAIGVLVKGN